VVVFRNGGPLRRNERFFFNTRELECVTYYKYLGIIFSSRLMWSVALTTLCSQAEKAVFMLKRLIRTCGKMPIQLSLDLFDKMVVPILLYGAEIWGTQNREVIETVHRKFCKYILSVSYNTSNAAVLGELGRLPLSVLYKYKSAKFWLNIVHDTSIRVRNSSYKMLKRYDESGGNNWVSDIKDMLYSLGFGDVWLQQGVGNVEIFKMVFKQRIADTCMQNWEEEVTNNSKLNNYKNYKTVLDLEIYLSTDIYWKHRVALTRFRCMNNRLSVERSRRFKIDRNARFCKYCKENNTESVEDEIHFLLVCPLYTQLRNSYLEKHFTCTNNVTENFVRIMSSKKQNCIKDLSAYIYYAFKIHTEFTTV